MDLDYSDNLEQSLSSLSSFLPEPGTERTLSIEADAGHAAYLHAREGFWVLHPAHHLAAVRRALSGKMQGRRLSGGAVLEALDEAGRREVDYLRSHVGLGPDGRPQHPGGWRDESGELHDSYDYDVS